ncbi:NtaA/DmoA family FMN-dependent monooxygenase [Rhodococcoides yunnanense]|uniref:NtaA/DmoA family FMN-dependent monooxygenase n=1 Tax=Rhodococcoides yunnanense TaxID=278209 RepID=UPI00093386D0|nr:NtaA/DmoA family FMN-dependent monooxygenase [Rhodococcus yunnanensis]
MTRFHLGWFNGAGFGLQGWGSPEYVHRPDPWRPDLFQTSIRELERGGFDFLVLEDSSMVPDAYGGSPDYYLERGVMAPKLDPVPLVPYLASVTEHIGIVPTLTTGFYHPWLLARLMTTLDHLTQGRIGWNIVTATTKLAWANYGLEQPEHDRRYDLADEFVEVATQLWRSFPASAQVLDVERGVAFSAENVKPIHFEGEFFSSRGPLNAPAGPQGSPVLFQAGGSPRGRAFAGKNAEAVIASCTSVEDMKSYYVDVKKHAVNNGRDPSSVKVLFATGVILGDTHQDAVDKAEAIRAAGQSNTASKLAGLSNITGIDFSTVDLDEPLTELRTNGSQSSLAEFLSTAAPGATLREVLATKTSPGVMGYPFIGTVDEVASRMKDVMDEVGGDGYLFGGFLRPGYIARLVDELVPALRKLDVIRTEYGNSTFRENLLEF